ncbi:MAG: hypothetical protein WBX07_01010 [Rhodoplanes sp.]
MRLIQRLLDRRDQPMHGLPQRGFQLMALFANSLRCDGASAAEGKPAVIGVKA